ncbi:hypothetical protein PT974_01850 [Cladobotryum mycophilum]|uniref:Uncharacterized protein n=1 Tax=Cladobotryum mycophilum TaxID=491253 RepID=A0ABR0SXJ8_9HYPO
MSTCAYDCSNQPSSVPSNPDITGIGVIVGYVGNAGIVVCIIVLFYLAAYDPTEDPFRSANDRNHGIDSIPFRPNPVDIILRDWGRRVKSMFGFGRKSPALVDDTEWDSLANTEPSHLKEACIKCVQCMSDIQILTGLSILLSGYANLKCGLSAYHWQVLVDIAWFANLTHLSCLTFLRNYLYNKPGEKAWRLFAMGLVAVLLVVAMFPTNDFLWMNPTKTNTEQQPSDYAICSFHRIREPDIDLLSSFVTSFLLIVLGFFSRVVKLHKILSVSIFGRARAAVSTWMRRWILKGYKKLHIGDSTTSLRRAIIYQPLFALFLLVRLALDFWTSMFIEVWWLVAGILVGINRLKSVLGLDNNDEDSQWTFGQIVSALLLAAPIMSISTYLIESYTGTRTKDKRKFALRSAETLVASRASTLPLSEKKESEPPPRKNQEDHPNRDYYRDAPWFETLVLFITLSIIFLTIWIIEQPTFYTRFIDLILLANPIGYQILAVVPYILLSWKMEHLQLRFRWSARTRNWMHGLFFLLLVLCTVGAFLILAI